MAAKDDRAQFALSHADDLAGKAGSPATLRLPPHRSRSARFVWYANDEQLTLVVGEHERRHVDSALAVGLGMRKDRLLRLILPRGWHEPALHRWPWLRADLPMEAWSHLGAEVIRHDRPTRAQTQELVRGDEDRQLHLGDRTTWVEDLMRWAGAQPDLDASHRRDVRAWHCRGQRVLRIKRSGSGLEVVAGIDWAVHSPNETPAPVALTGPLSAEQLGDLQTSVREGCDQRLNGVAHRADEHWLQAVLRRHPSVLGLEQPVLRELAAWRPVGSLGTKQRTSRGRGFVDLAGLDATGRLLIVETKLDGDHMLVLQGLDYRIWAEANRSRLTQRLDCRPDVPIEIAFCVGGAGGGEPGWSSYTQAQLEALAPDVHWHVQEVTDWTDDSATSRRSRACTWPPIT